MSAKRHGNADLTGFAALLGDGFAAKINLLAQIIQHHHYPSLGRYKENLLAKVITDFIPKRFEVGTGFVLFVHEATEERAQKSGFDAMNMGSHSISKQCDIIVYDSAEIPVVFRDGDFVVVRPDSVRAVIEVKGSASPHEIKSTLESSLDFGRKWQQCQKFYQKRSQALVRTPAMFAMCWDTKRSSKGRPTTSGKRIEKQIADFYRENLDKTDLKGLPRLDALYVYNECEVGATACVPEGGPIHSGYSAHSGRFLREKQGDVFRSGDRTVSSLLAHLHHAVSDKFNRFYSYADESRDTVPDEPFSFTPWLTDEEYIRDANSDFVDGGLRHERPER